MMPLPQAVSSVQVALQPSPGRTPPSSHCSLRGAPPWVMPSPQTSSLQPDEQPSPDTRPPSSHSSTPSSTPSPQTVSSSQSFEQPSPLSVPPSSQVSFSGGPVCVS